MHREPLYVRCAIDRCEGEATSGCRRCEKALCEAHVPDHYCRPPKPPKEGGGSDAWIDGALSGLGGCLPGGAFGIGLGIVVVLVVLVVQLVLGLRREWSRRKGHGQG